MNKFTLLDGEQIFGNNSLKVLKKYGNFCAITDYAILLGGKVSEDYTSEGPDLKNRAGYWWTKTPYRGQVLTVQHNLFSLWHKTSQKDVGVRPVTSYSQIKFISSIKVREEDFLEVEFGEYPQTIAFVEEEKMLEKLYQNGTLEKKGKIYVLNEKNIYVSLLMKKVKIKYCLMDAE